MHVGSPSDACHRIVEKRAPVRSWNTDAVVDAHVQVSSDTMYSLISFRKSTPLKKRHLNILILIFELVVPL